MANFERSFDKADGSLALTLTSGRETGKPSIETLEETLEPIHHDGMVVLEGVVSNEHLDAVNEVMWM